MNSTSSASKHNQPSDIERPVIKPMMAGRGDLLI
jgi:hypothetical protein